VLGLDLPKEIPAAGISEKEIENLIAKRDKARSAKDFKTADDIRRELSEKGVVLEDTKGTTVWRRRS
jgi:cysteinyl-tRNA synthetase